MYTEYVISAVGLYVCSHPTTCPHTPWPCNNSCSNSCLNPCRSPCLSPCFNHVSVGNVLLVHYTQSHRTRQLFLPQTYIYNQRCLELPILLATSAMLASLSRHARLKVNNIAPRPLHKTITDKKETKRLCHQIAEAHRVTNLLH